MKNKLPPPFGVLPLYTEGELKYFLPLGRVTSSSSVYRGGGSETDGGV